MNQPIPPFHFLLRPLKALLRAADWKETPTLFARILVQIQDEAERLFDDVVEAEVEFEGRMYGHTVLQLADGVTHEDVSRFLTELRATANPTSIFTNHS